MLNSLSYTPFIGQIRKSLPKCQSTNDVMLDWLHSTELSEGAVVDTDFQSKGRGQQGNQWESAPQQNLTFSLLLRPAFLAPDQLYCLSMVAALAIKQVLETFIPNLPALVKWPNDVYIQGKKIAGTLIETSIRGDMIEYAIVGIGLNVNQLRFKHTAATSMALVGNKSFDKELILQSLFKSLEQFYALLKNGSSHEVENLYKSHLMGLGEKKMFEAENVFIGIIRDVNRFGQLVVEVGDQLKAFHNKEIRMLS